MIHISEVPAVAELALEIENRRNANAVVDAADVDTFAVFQTEGRGSTQLFLDPDDAADAELIRGLRERFAARAQEAAQKDHERAAELGLNIDSGPRSN